MARKKEQTDDLAGTVEGLARDHFEREKAAYEERTGEKVQFVPPTPVTRTPIPEPVNEPAETAEAEAQPTVENQSEGDD
jgi:hypothetical protein